MTNDNTITCEYIDENTQKRCKHDAEFELKSDIHVVGGLFKFFYCEKHNRAKVLELIKKNRFFVNGYSNFTNTRV